ELEGEVSKLLDRVKNKLIPANEAKPKVKALSSEIDEITKTETEFEDFSAILPIEQIIEDRNNERQKYKRLQTLKGDKAISRGTYDEMEVKYKKNLEGLNMKLNIELTKMKKTFDALENKMKQLQRDLEILYVQSQTGELGEKAYQKSKVEKSSEIDRMKKVSQAVKAILSEAK
ncbi:MAG: CdvA-like protein, partial [Candidatus Heimdallarchaeota archaeon]|nr:CdvA-like protein [Candidatus Heimdallarchaeota archaeon]